MQYTKETRKKEKENNHHKTSKVIKMTGITTHISTNLNINGLISLIKETKQTNKQKMSQVSTH